MYCDYAYCNLPFNAHSIWACAPWNQHYHLPNAHYLLILDNTIWYIIYRDLGFYSIYPCTAHTYIQQRVYRKKLWNLVWVQRYRDVCTQTQSFWISPVRAMARCTRGYSMTCCIYLYTFHVCIKLKRKKKLAQYRYALRTIRSFPYWI